MAPGNLATLDEPLQLPTGGRLSENLLAVEWVHRGVTIPVENDCRYREPRPRRYRAPAGGLPEPHSGESRGHIMGCTACEPGMHSQFGGLLAPVQHDNKRHRLSAI